MCSVAIVMWFVAQYLNIKTSEVNELQSIHFKNILDKLVYIFSVLVTEFAALADSPRERIW
jgi:hypothetical protein